MEDTLLSKPALMVSRIEIASISCRFCNFANTLISKYKTSVAIGHYLSVRKITKYTHYSSTKRRKYGNRKLKIKKSGIFGQIRLA